MKQTLLLLVGVALANAAAVVPVPPQEGYFAAGREYLYQYEGQVLSGIPGVSKEVAGIKIVAETRIQMRAENRCWLRLEEVRLNKMQRDTEDPTKQQTDDKLERLPQVVESPLVQELVKPVEFRYVNGKVSNIVMSKDQPAWASNIIKGAMELMMVNIRGTEDLNQPEVQSTEPTSIIHQKENYRVMERGIAGNCESVYNVKVTDAVPIIIDKQVQPKRYVMNIAKTRDLMECQQRTQRSQLSLISGKKCDWFEQKQEGMVVEQTGQTPVPFNRLGAPTEKKENLLKCLSQVRYSISLKNHDKFVIDSVVAEGKHIFRPFGPSGGEAVAFVNQLFVLKNNRETPADHLIPDVTNPREQPEDLRFVFQDWEMHEHDPEEEQELTKEDAPHMTQIRTKVKSYIQKIYDAIQVDRVMEDAPKQFILMVKTLKKFSPVELQNIFDRLGKTLSGDTEIDKEKKMILLDAMIQVENAKSVEILVGEIEKRNFVGEQASQILSTIGLINDPSEEMLDLVLNLCKGPIMNGANADKQVKKTCWLSFGSLVHKACKVNKICTDVKKYEYSMNLLAGIEPTQTKEDQRMCLKAIGNSGLILKKTATAETDSIDRIAEIIRSDVTDVDLRMQAIFSLRRLAKTAPERIIPILMPLVKNMKEHHQVRIAAYVIIMDTEPQSDTVQSIVADIQTDDSRQVASFVYSHLEGLITNKPNCEKELIMVAKKSLLLLRPVIKGAQYSKRFMWSPKFYKKKVSIHAEASIIGTPVSPFPVSGSVKLGATILDHQMNIVEVGFHAKSLRDIAEKILGVAKPVRNTQEKLRKMNRRVPEEHEKSPTERDLDAMDRELPTTQIDPELLKASGYLKFFGNELRTFTVDKPTFWSYLEGTSERMVEIEDKIRSGENPYTVRKIFSLGRGMHEIPTEIGLPLQLWVDSAAVIALDVTGKAVLTPRLTDLLKNKTAKLETVEVEGKVKPRAAVSVMGKMKVSLDNVLAGLYYTGTLQTSVALNGTVNVDMAKRLYKTRFDTPSTEHQAFSLRSRPYTMSYIKEGQATETTVTPESNFIKKLIKGKMMSPMPITTTWSWGRKTLGVEMELKTRRVPRSCSYIYGPTQVLFNGPIDVNITARQGENAPQAVIAQMKLENEFKTQEEYREFKEKYLVKQHFLTESSSEESDEHKHDNGNDVPSNRKSLSFLDIGEDLFKRFEDWKYDTAKWPFSGEQVEDRSHDETPVVEPNADRVELYHIYFNITAESSQPIREFASRISLDQQNEFYKAVRVDVMTAEKSFRANAIHQDQFEWKTEEIRTMCVQGELEHPAYAVTLPASAKLEHIPGLPDAPIDSKVLFKFSNQWGKSCLHDQKMQIKARVERSDQQLKELSEQTPDKIECLKNIREGNKYTQACKTLRLEREELRAVHAELTHNEQVKKVYKTIFYQGLEMIKNMFWGMVQTEQAEVHNPDKTVLLTGEMERTNKRLNISIKHVRGNVKFNELWIPQMIQDWKVLQPYKLEQHMIMSLSEDQLNGRNINQCKSLKNNSIITFDKVKVDYEQSTCEHILAKDCSSKERFVILTRKLAQTSTKKVITIYINNTKIQFVPSEQGEDIVTKIDDVVQALPVRTKLTIEDGVIKRAPFASPTVHIMDVQTTDEAQDEADLHQSSRERKHKTWDMPESASSEEIEMGAEELTYWEDFKKHIKQDIAMEPQQLPAKPKILVKIIRAEMGDSIMVFAPEQELKVFFDGQNAKVELPQKYKGLHCGLCADFNGEISNELDGPNREVYKNARRFGRSYQITTLQCTKVDQCAPAMEFAFDTEVTLPSNKNQFACITKAPVPRCQPSCTPVHEEPVDAEFVCIEHEGTTDPFTAYNRKEVIAKYMPKTADYKRTMPMATKCAREQ